jgi:hypothetical protein
MIDVGRDFERMQSYVAGRLSEDEQRSFEDRLARDPALVMELEQSLRFREGLEHLKDRGYFDAIAARTAKTRAAWLPVALAAGIAALAAFIWLRPHTSAPALLSATLPVAHGQPPAASVAAHFTFMALRGQMIPDLELPKNGLIELRTRPAGGPGDYRMELTRATESKETRPLATISAVAREDGYVYAYADAARLEPGSYVLSIRPQNTSETAESFRFKLHRAAAAP